MSNRIYIWVLIGILATLGILGSGCTGTGHLSEGDRLYAGARIKITKSDSIGSVKQLKTDLKKVVILPRPNKKILWMRPGLVIFHMFKNSRPKSLGSFIANRMGEAPVLYDAKIVNRQRELLKERAANTGFFKTKIIPSEKPKKRTVKLSYEVQVRAPRELVDKVMYSLDSTTLTRKIYDLRSQSIVKQQQPYYLENLLEERQRLSDTLRNHGWYFFSPDHFLFEADTLHPPGDLNLTLRVKNEVGKRDRQQYRINSITVFPDYDLALKSDSTQQQKDTLYLGCVKYVYQDMATRPEVINRQIYLRCGDLFSNSDYQITIYRLLNLNLYKFVNIRFEVSPGNDSLLDVRIYLTPYRPERIEGTISAVFSPSYYAGLRLGALYHHRNIFSGAEALHLALNGAYLRTNNKTFEFEDFLVSDATARLSLPYMLFLQEKRSLAFGATQFSIRHEANRFKYNLPELGRFGLSFQRLGAEGGYLWKKNRRGSVIHAANPLSLGLQYSTTSDRSIRQQLIGGIPDDSTGASRALLTFLEFKPNYTFTLDQRLEPARKRMVYFRQRFAAQASGYTPNKFLPADFPLESPFNLFLESDYRQYYKTQGKNVLAFRAAIGAGIPLRSNGTIALLDRFVIGGASSVRAFAPRSVGPGGQQRDTATTGIKVGNYTGNLLIESSLEYRVPIGRYPELAFFADAGNIWLTSGPDATEASKFRLKQFYKELALGAGLGLRINLGFFVLRLDVAFPLTKPFLPEGQRWVGHDLHFGQRSWRRENLNWNFSFGYPF